MSARQCNRYQNAANLYRNDRRGKRYMRKAALIYNPVSGSQPERRVAEVEIAAEALRAGGVNAIPIATENPGSAGDQTQRAIAAGCDAVFACGGDGTVNEVVQGLIASRTTTALGVIPLGTANALAHDLRIPRDPAGAARSALTAERQKIAVGQVQCLSLDGKPITRYFVVATGIGVDAHLFYKLNFQLKQKHGMAAYYAQAASLWFTHHFASFEILFGSKDEGPRKEVVSQALAVRISQFGGVLKRLAPGAALRRDDLRLVIFKTASRVPYILYVLGRFLEQEWRVPGVELADTTHMICRPLGPDGQPNGSDVKKRIYVEVDGELIGTLPADISMAQDAITLLVPQKLATVKATANLIPAAASPSS